MNTLDALILAVFFVALAWTAWGAFQVGRRIRHLEKLIQAMKMVDEAHETEQITSEQSLYLLRTYIDVEYPEDYTAELEAEFERELEEFKVNNYVQGKKSAKNPR